jgi:hypothetical protein
MEHDTIFSFIAFNQARAMEHDTIFSFIASNKTPSHGA